MLASMGRRIALAGAVVVVLGLALNLVLGSDASPRHHPRPLTQLVASGLRRTTPHAATAGRRRHVVRVSTPSRASGPFVDVLAHGSGSGSRCQKPPPPVPEHQITHRRWLTGVTITEYYPAPERWFGGRRVVAPGLPGRHAVDWLYSARGLAMEGAGVDLTGRPVHIAQLGSTGWVNFGGHGTVPVCLGKWSDGFPVWLKGGWRNRRGEVTYPLAAGGWANGPGRGVLDYGGVTFSQGASLPLTYYHSIAVDPGLIPLGSRVFIPAYRKLGGGWFIAQDTGGAIRGRHVDVYRPAPASPDDLGRYMTGQRILVIPPTG
jgi:3D (Asp-Asp-Asp) domain-containing protein